MAWWRHKSVVNLLSECCICRNQASVMFPAVQAIYRGEFAGLDDTALRILLYPGNQGENELCIDCLCCISFNHEYRPHLFLTSVIKHGESQAEQSDELVLEIPSQILAEKRRIALRIPVSSDSRLHVNLQSPDGQTWTPVIRNVSVAGMLIEFSEGDDPNLAPGFTPEVFLQLDQNEVRLQAEVKRRDGRAYGLSFPEIVCGQKLEPPTELQAIVRALERSWYQKPTE